MEEREIMRLEETKFDPTWPALMPKKRKSKIKTYNSDPTDSDIYSKKKVKKKMTKKIK